VVERLREWEKGEGGGYRWAFAFTAYKQAYKHTHGETIDDPYHNS